MKMDGKLKLLVVLGVITTILIILSTNSYGIVGGVVAFLAELAFGQVIKELFKILAKVWMINTAKAATIDFLEKIYDNLPYLLKNQPAINEIWKGMFFFMNLIILFYAVSIIGLGIYAFVASTSYRKRAKAKMMISKLFLSLVIFIISPGILQLLFIISEILARYLFSLGAEAGIGVLKSGGESLYDVFWKFTLVQRTGGVEMFALYITLLLGILTVVLLREAMVILFGMLLPLGVFLYSIHPTEKIGKGLIIQTILWTFVPVVWALALLILKISASTISYVPLFYVHLAAIFFFLGAPILILGVSDWLSFLVLLFEILQAAPLSIGVVVIDETLK